MKKLLFFVLTAAMLGFASCSNDDTEAIERTTLNGMELRATVKQPSESQATSTDEGVWKYAFSKGDKITVTNNNISTDYTFTNNGTSFFSTNAEPTKKPARWYAYYPSKEVSFVGQTGKLEDLAKVYALIGSTPYGSDVNGENGLNITMEQKCAIIKIINIKGSIDIHVMSDSLWVKGLKGSKASFVPAFAENKQTLLNTTEPGIYYIAVPSGIQISVKNGDKVIKSTGTSGLTAGKYYNLQIGSLEGSTGTTSATGINGGVKWVQLWKDGPRFAEYNVGVTDGKVENYGGYYKWSENIASTQWGDNWRMPTKDEFDKLLENCDVKWTEDYKNDGTNIRGRIFTGKGFYSGNSIFFPAAGYHYCSFTYYPGRTGRYWSSTFPNYESAYILGFSAGDDLGIWGESISFTEFPVRAVLNEVSGTTGTAKATIDGVDTDVNWIQLWENGPKFAEYNIGATSETEYGDYCTWKYDVTPWGINWRVPTKDDFDNLLANCDVRWTDDYNKDGTNIKGIILTGKDSYSTNYIFLPAAGNDNNCYWSSTLNGYSEVYGLAIDLNSQLKSLGISGCRFPVRAVLNENPDTTKGFAEVKESAGVTSNMVRWIQLWAGGPKFAELNVGATLVTECGGYYCWGKCKNLDPSGAYKNGGLSDLSGTDDTATALWGDNWRMPTSDEFDALFANCDVLWENQYNGLKVPGIIFTGRGDYADNSIFLPAGGYCDHSSVREWHNWGNYWSSSTGNISLAYNLHFRWDSQLMGHDYRYTTASPSAQCLRNNMTV